MAMMLGDAPIFEHGHGHGVEMAMVGRSVGGRWWVVGVGGRTTAGRREPAFVLAGASRFDSMGSFGGRLSLRLETARHLLTTY